MAWWKTAKPGDPVVCVDAYWEPDYSPLIEGRVYRFQKVVQMFGHDGVYHGVVEEDPIDIFVLGAENPECGGFHPNRFRPAQAADLPEELTQLLDQPVSDELKERAR